MVENSQSRKLGRPRNFDPDEVLNKVIDVFLEYGYQGSDTETLSKRAGLTKPSLYNTFGSKEDLFVAAIKYYKQSRSIGIKDALARANTPKEWVGAYFLHLAESIADPNHPSGCLIFSVAMPLRDQLPKVGALLADMLKNRRMKMISYFDEQKREGNLPENFDSIAAASLLEDLSAALRIQARSGTDLDTLKSNAIRNAELVLFEGNRNKI